MQSETQKISSEKDKEEASTILNACSFSNYIDQSTITPFKLFLQENIKSFNLLPNEENSFTENDLEKSLKAKYNFDTPILEIVLKITSDYDLIRDKLKEYLDLFGEINSINYDHNANTVKINYKYYFSCLYANRSLTNIFLKTNEANTAIDYYSSCNYSNKSINTTMSKDKSQIEISENKNLSKAFKFLTENYKTNNKFKTQIIGKGKNEDNICQNIAENEELKNNENIENMANNNNERIFSTNFKPANVAEISDSNNFKNTKKYKLQQRY